MSDDRGERHVFDRMRSVEDEYDLIETSLADPGLLADQSRLREVSKRYKDLTPLVESLRLHRAKLADAEAAREYMNAATGDDRDLWREELASAEAEVEALERRLRLLMVPRDANEGKGVIMEIRGAEGGEEANLWARDLFEMYQSYASMSGWKVEVLSIDPSDLGGVNQATFVVRGDTAWSRLKFEGGPHRVQRVPATESQGRIHTSSATVLVLPEADEVDVEIDERDLEVDVYRSSGAGGQSVNTTDSAVRITHKPTGIMVTMQDERSQLQNKARAMTVLRARLLRAAQEEHDAAAALERRAQVGGGGRGEKIRTYNFKENRLTDHRIGFTIYRLQDVLAGHLDEVVDALIADERARQLADPVDV
jgi:peptide chain release factor 1